MPRGLLPHPSVGGPRSTLQPVARIWRDAERANDAVLPAIGSGGKPSSTSGGQPLAADHCLSPRSCISALREEEEPVEPKHPYEAVSATSLRTSPRHPSRRSDGLAPRGLASASRLQRHRYPGKMGRALEKLDWTGPAGELKQRNPSESASPMLMAHPPEISKAWFQAPQRKPGIRWSRQPSPKQGWDLGLVFFSKTLISSEEAPPEPPRGRADASMMSKLARAAGYRHLHAADSFTLLWTPMYYVCGVGRPAICPFSAESMTSERRWPPVGGQSSGQLLTRPQARPPWWSGSARPRPRRLSG